MNNKINGAQWNGNPVDAEHVVIQVLDGEGDFMWWKPYVGCYMIAIKVIYGNDSFVVCDSDGQGTRKTLNGGCPPYPHREFENYRVLSEDEQIDLSKLTKYKHCELHEWAQEELPLFKTKSSYCIHCRTPKMFHNLRGMNELKVI